MEKRNILLGVTGGIAAYKAIDLASLLAKDGFAVKCVLTEHAREFVSALNFEAITHETTHTEMFRDADPIPHINLADWADLIAVAPATANIMAKAAHGIGDDLLSTILLAHTKPVLFVPAMNVHMWEAVPTQENVRTLRERGNHVLAPAVGALACGYTGSGKYPPNVEVRAAILTYLRYGRDLEGVKALVTAGATVEPLDPMRYLSNRSSGKMGVALARALALRGADVTLVHGRIEQSVPHILREAVFANTAEEMRTAVLERFAGMDWIIKCAAVADYRPADYSPAKMPKAEMSEIRLAPTPDILKELGARKLPGQKLVGFAAQSGDLVRKALEKYRGKNLDLICVNNISVAGAEDSEVTVIGKLPGQPALAEDSGLNAAELRGSKFEIAHRIADLVKTL